MRSWLRKGLRSIAVLLTVSLTLSLLTLGSTSSALAAAPNKPFAVGKKAQFPLRPNTGARTEITKLRGRNVRHYLEPNGKFTAEVFRDPIFFEDAKTHVMLPIDNTLKPATQTGFAYSSTANRFATLFAARADARPLAHVSFDGSTLEFRATDVGSARGVVTGNTITYQSAYPGVDLKYEVLSDGLKESMILTSADSPTKFTFMLTPTNLTYKAQDDGSIAFYQPGKSEPALLLPKPFMYEAGEEPLASQNVTQAIRQEGEQLFLDITADAAW